MVRVLSLVILAISKAAATASTAADQPDPAGWRVTSEVDAFEGGEGGGGASAHWQTLGRLDNTTACAALCGTRSGNVFAWHHPPERMCHCSAAVRAWRPSSNIRVDSGCRADGCLSPGPPSPPGLPPAALPRWIGADPDPSKPLRGLRELQGATRVTIYNSSLADGSPNPLGLYNHGPMIIYIQQTLAVDSAIQNHWLACWYNGPQREAHMNRIVFSIGSAVADHWSPPIELFPPVNGHGEENEPFAIVSGRLYGTASDVLLDNAHDSGVQGGLLMRRIYSGSRLGPIFWAASRVPDDVNASLRYPLYTEMDGTTVHDVEQYLGSLVNQTVRNGNSVTGPGTVSFNERSMYALPANLESDDQEDPTSLAMLLRYGGGSSKAKQQHLWGSRCVLQPSSNPVLPDNAQSGTFSCRSGTGAYEYEIPSLSNTGQAPTPTQQGSPDALRQSTAVSPRQCNWSTPVETNLPDAPSRTCAGRLPSKLGIGLVGNQGGVGTHASTPRDPLTFCQSKDGLRFDGHWIVDSNSPTPKWFGYQGFQYPSFTWCTDGCQSKAGASRASTDSQQGPGLRNIIIFTYSISKEDIVLKIAPLSSIE